MQEDQKTASRLANTMSNTLKGRPVQVSYSLQSSWEMYFLRLVYKIGFLQGRIFEGKEPPQFVALFQPMVVLKVFCLSSYEKLLTFFV